MKINNFQGELTDISAKKEAMLYTGPNLGMRLNVHRSFGIIVLGAVLVFWRGRIVVVFALESIQALFEHSQVSMLDNEAVSFDD